MLYLDYSRARGRVGAQRVRRPRGPRRGRVPQGAQRGRLRPRARDRARAAEESTAWPGVSRPTYLGGLGLRLQVEHGLDARHARLLPAGPDLPPLPPPRADLQPDVRVQRELHPAALARRGRARQGLADREDAGRPLAEARQPARAVRLHVGAPRQEAAVHGRRVRAGGASGATSARSTGTCSSSPSTPASRRWSATSTALYRDEPALWEVDSDPTGFWWLEPNDADANVVAFARASTRRRARRWCASPTCRRCRATATGSACRARGRWREALNTDSTFYGGSDVGNLGGVERRADPVARPARARPSRRCRRSAASGSCPMAVSCTCPRRRARRADTLGATARRAAARRRHASSSASGRRGAESVVAAARADATSRSTDAGYGVYEAVAAGARRATTTGSSLDGASRCPIRARAGSRDGLRGPSRVRRPAPRSRWTAASGRRRSSELVIYELHVGTFTREGTFAAAIPHLRRARRARRHRDRAHAGGRVPGRARLGLRRRLPLRRALGLRRPARACAARRRRARRGLAVILDVVYNHVGASGVAGARGVRPVLHRPSTRRPGARRSTTTTPTATRCASGCSRAPSGWIRDFGIDGLRLDAIHAIFDSSAEHIVAALAARVHAVARRRAGDRRERPQRPAGDARRRAAAGPATRPGPTTSTTPCARC